MTVTEAAMTIVRPVARQYVGSVKTSLTLSKVKLRTTALVSSSIVKNAVASSAEERGEVDQDQPGQRCCQQTGQP